MFYFCSGMIRSGSTWQYNIVKSLLEKRGLAKPFGYGFIGNEIAMDELVKSHGNFFVKMHESYQPALDMVKTHSAKAVFIHRDLRDVAASLMVRHQRNLKWVLENDLIHKAWKNYQRWTSVPGILIQQYEKVMINMPVAIKEIAQYLEIDLHPGELEELNLKYSLEKQKEVLKNMKGASGINKMVRKLRRRIGNSLYSFIGKRRTQKIARYFGKVGIGGMDADTLLMSEHINTGETGSYKKVMSKAEIEKIEQYLISLKKQSC